MVQIDRNDFSIRIDFGSQKKETRFLLKYTTKNKQQGRCIVFVLHLYFVAFRFPSNFRILLNAFSPFFSLKNVFALLTLCSITIITNIKPYFFFQAVLINAFN